MARTSSRTIVFGVLSMQAILRGPGVGGEAFAFGQLRRDQTELVGTLARYLDQAGALLKVVHAERRREACGTCRRQYVVRPGTVVTQRFRGILANEDRAGVTDLREPALGVL